MEPAAGPSFTDDDDDDSSTTGTNESSPDLTSESEYSDPEPLVLDNEENVEKSSDDVLEGDFLLVKYKFGKATKTYVGQVEKIHKTSYSLKFLRRHRGSDRSFAFPTVQDKDNVTSDQIIGKLENPNIRRGIYQFPMTSSITRLSNVQ